MLIVNLFAAVMVKIAILMSIWVLVKMKKEQLLVKQLDEHFGLLVELELRFLFLGQLGYTFVSLVYLRSVFISARRMAKVILRLSTSMIRSTRVSTNGAMNPKSSVATRSMNVRQIIQQSQIYHRVCIAVPTWFLNLVRKRVRQSLFNGRSPDKLKYWDSKEMEDMAK